MTSGIRSSSNAPVRRYWLIIPPAIAVFIYAPSLFGGFLGDDFVYVRRFIDYPWSNWPNLFVREWSEGTWGFPLMELRPFAALSFMMDGQLWGSNALGYRCTNLLLFLGAVWLVSQLAYRYSGRNTLGALTAGVVFALHPIHVEAVAWICGRVDLLASLASLTFWWHAERFVDTGRYWRLLASGAGLFVGIFSKEFALLVPFLLLAGWVLMVDGAPANWKRRSMVLCLSAGSIAAYAWCRHTAFGNPVSTPFGWDGPAWQRQVSYIGWALPWLPFDREAGFQWQIGFAGTTIRAVWLTAAAAIVSCAVYCRLTRRTKGATYWFFAGIWWIVTVAGLLAAGYFSPRHLHFPIVGAAIAVGALAAWQTRTWLRIGVPVALVVWLGLAQIHILGPWREAGLVSRKAVAVLNDVSRATSSESLLAFASQPGHWNAWLFAWSVPSIAAAPFVEPGWPRNRVVVDESLYDRAGWPEYEAPLLLARVSKAPAVVLFVVEYDGTIRHRTLVGDELAARVGVLAALTDNGLTSSEWNQWVREAVKP